MVSHKIRVDRRHDVVAETAIDALHTLGLAYPGHSHGLGSIAMTHKKGKEESMFEAAHMCCMATPRNAQAALRRLGENLRRVREARHDSVETMAHRCFTTPMVIAALESGDAHVPLGVLASVLFMSGKEAELALVCHPGGAQLDVIRERAEEAIKEFQNAMKEFLAACGGDSHE
jgi:transcriptional regulator with XRE-family HTH domain